MTVTNIHADTDLHVFTDVARAAGITYRQADFWASQGYVHAPLYGGANYSQPVAGSTGNLRRLTTTEAQILHLMSRLVTAGFGPATAARLARTAITEDRGRLEIAPGLHLLVDIIRPRGQAPVTQ